VTTGTAVAGAETAAGRVTAMETAFKNFVYGAGKAVSATLAFSAAGKVTVTTTGPLTYAITKGGAALQLLLILLLAGWVFMEFRKTKKAGNNTEKA
jgi:hypothetical protein